MKIIKMTAICAAIATLTGCASIAGDNTRNVKVNSTPAGAAVYMDGQRFGTTPTTLTLPSSIYGGKTLTIKKLGYQNESVTVNTQFQPVAILDVLFWPTFLVDAATGSLVKIDPGSRNFDVALTK